MDQSTPVTQARWGQPAVYNATPPTLTDKASAALQVDANGRLMIAGVVSGGGSADGAAFTPSSSSATTVAGYYSSTPQSVSNNQTGALAMDQIRNLLVNLATRLDEVNDRVTVFPYGHAVYTSTAAGTFTVKTGAGVIHSVHILGGTAGSFTGYDNTAASGTTPIPSFTPGSVAQPLSLAISAGFSTGFTYVTGTAMTVAVIYR